MSKSPAVTVAKSREEMDGIHTLKTGAKVRLHPVSATLIMEVQNGIPYPPVPIIRDEEKGQTYENPNHPAYVREVNDVETKRSMAAMDAIIMFGVELVDGIPKDDTWVRKLKTLDRRGGIGLSDYDLEDEIDLEFLYKKHVAVSSDDYEKINTILGVTEEGVTSAEDTFPGNA